MTGLFPVCVGLFRLAEGASGAEMSTGEFAVPQSVWSPFFKGLLCLFLPIPPSMNARFTIEKKASGITIGTGDQDAQWIGNEPQ